MHVEMQMHNDLIKLVFHLQFVVDGKTLFHCV